MKGIRITGIVVFLIAASATAGYSLDGNAAGVLHSFTLPSAQCTDILRGGILAPDRVEILGSEEFAVSMEAVASGMSYYSPGFVPAGWKAEASAWREQAAGRSVLRTRGMSPGEDLCPSSSLIFRAFLDYRAKTGQPDLRPVYPYQVRKAAVELSDRFARAARIAHRVESSIREAERMGARECSPTELSIAWASLEEAGRRTAENGYDVGKTEEAFGNAERAAANLLVKRQLASSGRFACYSR